MKSNKFLTYAIVTGLLSVLFIPFIIADSQLFPFITGKGFVFRILVELLFGLWVAGMFFDSSIRPKVTWLTWSVLGLTGVVFLADLFGHSFYHSFWSSYERMDGFITTLHVVGYFFVASSVLNTRERWKIFFNVSVVASVIMSFYTFMQLAGKVTINQGGVRIDGTFGNATYLAVYMLFNIFITLFLLLGVYEKGGKNKWYLYIWYVVALLCQSISLYNTQTRGAILGLIGGLLLTSLIVAVFEKYRPGLRKVGAGLLVLVVIIVGGFFALKNTDFVTKSPTLHRFSSITVQSINNQGRRYVWPMAWQGFKDRPVLGWGQENFNYVFNKYYDPRMYNQEPWFDRAHNIILDWLVTTGLIGLLAYLSLFVAALSLLWKNSEYSLSQKGVLVGLLAAYFFQNMFVFDNLVSYIYFFSILAFIHSEVSRSKAYPAWLDKVAQNRSMAQTAIPAIAGVVVIVLIYSLNVQPISASRNLIRGLSTTVNTPEQSLDYFKKVFAANTFGSAEATDQMTAQFGAYDNPNIALETRQAYAKILLENLDRTINKYPDDARYLLSMGSLRIRMGDVNGAVPYLDRAHNASPQKQQVYFEIGLGALTAGDYTKALDQFKTAYELDKGFTEAKVLYAVAAIYAKQDKLANSLITELTQDPDFFDERIISAYVNTSNAAAAVKILEARVATFPDDPALRLRLSAGYFSIGQKAKSIAVLQDVLKRFPELPAETKKNVEYYIKEIQAGRDPTKPRVAN